MNADELELDSLQGTDKATNTSDGSVSNEDQRVHSPPNRRLRVLSERRSTTTRRSRSETYRLQRPVAESVSSQALHIFLYNTVIHSPSGSASKGHFTNLVTLMQSSSRLDALPFALDAVALASLARRFSYPDAKVLAMNRYQHSIRLLRDTDITSASNMLSVIACIQLLGIYEVCTILRCAGICIKHVETDELGSVVRS